MVQDFCLVTIAWLCWWPKPSSSNATVRLQKVKHILDSVLIDNKVLLMVDKSDCGHQTLNASGQILDMAKVSWARMKYFYGTFKLCILFSKNVSFLPFMAGS